MLKNRDVLRSTANTPVAARIPSNPKAHEPVEVIMVSATQRIQGAIRVQALSVSHISLEWSQGYEYPKSTGWTDAVQERRAYESPGRLLSPFGRLTKTAGDYSNIRYQYAIPLSVSVLLNEHALLPLSSGQPADEAHSLQTVTLRTCTQVCNPQCDNLWYFHLLAVRKYGRPTFHIPAVGTTPAYKMLLNGNRPDVTNLLPRLTPDIRSFRRGI